MLTPWCESCLPPAAPARPLGDAAAVYLPVFYFAAALAARYWGALFRGPGSPTEG